MIKTQAEFREAHRRLQQLEQNIAIAADNLRSRGLTDAEINESIAGLLREHGQIQQEISWFQEAKKGHAVSQCKLKDIGSLLISLRLAKGLSQKDLARLLKVSSAQVSKDEQRNYSGLSFERAIKILDALEAKIDLHLDANRIEIQASESAKMDDSFPVENSRPVEPSGQVETENETQQPQEPPEVNDPRVNDQIVQESLEPEVELVTPPVHPKTKLLLKAGIKSNHLGIGHHVQKAISRIEESLFKSMHAKKISSSQKFFAVEAEYEFPLERSVLEGQLESLNSQCQALAIQEKCWAKIEFV